MVPQEAENLNKDVRTWDHSRDRSVDGSHVELRDLGSQALEGRTAKIGLDGGKPGPALGTGLSPRTQHLSWEAQEQGKKREALKKYLKT